MVSQSDILRVVKEHGPILPAQISEYIGADTMLIGALLSDLLSSQLIRITKQKWSGSPLYYVDSQIEDIQKLSEKFNDKDLKAFELLKEQKVLQDSTQTPIIRTCLRALKDFALPLKVKTPKGEELFWKWYLISNEDVITILKTKFASQNQPVVQKEEKVEPVQSVQVQKSVEEKLVKKVTENQPKIEQKKPKQPEKQKIVHSNIQKGSLLAVSDSVFSKYQTYFESQNIEILQVEVLKKEQEFDVILRIPTQIGFLKMYGKIKQKKKSSDADLSQAYVKGSLQHLATVYIHSGELTKKAQELLATDFSMICVLHVDL